MDRADIMSRVIARIVALSLLGFLLAGAGGVVETRPVDSAVAPWSAVDLAASDAVTAVDVPGVVVLVGQGDRVLYARATGSRALVPSVEPMTLDTVFDVASLTKVVATM